LTISRLLFALAALVVAMAEYRNGNKPVKSSSGDGIADAIFLGIGVLVVTAVTIFLSFERSNIRPSDLLGQPQLLILSNVVSLRVDLCGMGSCPSSWLDL